MRVPQQRDPVTRAQFVERALETVVVRPPVLLATRFDLARIGLLAVEPDGLAGEGLARNEAGRLLPG